MNTLMKNGRFFFFGLFLSILLSVSVNAQVFSGPGFTIGDGEGRVPASCSTIPVSGFTSSVNVTSITLTNINHSWLGDTETRVYLPGSAPPPSTAGSYVISSPPDNTPCNFAGTYRFVDSAAQSVDAATTGCADAANLPSGDYRANAYGGGTNPGPVTSLRTGIGALTPAQVNGDWLVCVFDFAAPDSGTVGGTSILFSTLGTTAAPVSVSGRVTTASGRGIRNVQITMIDASGIERTAQTTAFGYYRFETVPAGETVTLSAKARQFRFVQSTIVRTTNESISGADFVSEQ